MPKRETWTHAAVAELVRKHQTYGDAATYSPREQAKLVELGLVAKTAPVVLSEDQLRDVEDGLDNFRGWDEPQRTLAVRYAIAKLRELLPKRTAAEAGS